MNSRAQLAEHLVFFAELGVAGLSRDPVWKERHDEPVAPPRPASLGGGQFVGVAAPLNFDGDEHSVAWPTSQVFRSAAEALAHVRHELGDCTRCKLHQLGRRQIVFGVGNPDADLMFVGEAPGQDEDQQGIPFVGRAGQLLTKIIESIGLARDEVYIANVIKCRPPENRNPQPDEVSSCEPFLLGQIGAIHPKVIVALGTFAARTLLKTEDPISRLRGRVYHYQGAKLVATFHPAFLLRSPDRKRDVWEDMKTVRGLLRET